MKRFPGKTVRWLAGFGVLAGMLSGAHGAQNGYIQQEVWAQTDILELLEYDYSSVSPDGHRFETTLLHEYNKWTSAIDPAAAFRLHDEKTVTYEGYIPDPSCRNSDGVCDDVVPYSYSKTYVNYDISLYSRADDVRGSLHVAVNTPVIYRSATYFSDYSRFYSDDNMESDGIAKSVAGLYGSFTVAGSGIDPVMITAQAKVSVTMSFAGYIDPDTVFEELWYGSRAGGGTLYAGVDLFRTDDGGGRSYVWLIGAGSVPGYQWMTGKDMTLLSESCSEFSLECSYEILLSESMLVTPGETINLNMNIEASSRQSGYTIDASNSAYLSFLLPEGYSIQGQDGFLADVPVTSVPEPATWALLASGLGLIAAATRRRIAS